MIVFFSRYRWVLQKVQGDLKLKKQLNTEGLLNVLNFKNTAFGHGSILMTCQSGVCALAYIVFLVENATKRVKANRLEDLLFELRQSFRFNIND